MTTTRKKKKIICPSAHGASGYVVGTYVKNGRIYCGFCKKDISEDVTITESIYEPYKWHENFWKWFNNERRYTGKTRTLTLKDKIKKLPTYVKNYDE